MEEYVPSCYSSAFAIHTFWSLSNIARLIGLSNANLQDFLDIEDMNFGTHWMALMSNYINNGAPTNLCSQPKDGRLPLRACLTNSAIGAENIMVTSDTT